MMSMKDKTVKDNLEFVYGRKIAAESDLLDPDKFRAVKSAPKMVDTTAITQFTGEFNFLHPSFSCEVFYFADKSFYPSFEHALQASKFIDLSFRTQVKDIPNIIEVKRLVSKQKNNDQIIDPSWNDNCVQIGEKLLRDKFMRNKVLKAKLTETGNKSLVFVNSEYKDVFWGTDEKRVGQNKLGKSLEKIRNEISKNEITAKWIAQTISLIPPEQIRFTVHMTVNGIPVPEESPQIVENRNIVYMGKHASCELEADDVSISRIHAAIVVEKVTNKDNTTVTTAYLIDLDSANGTEVDSVRALPYQLTPLTSDSKIRFGASKRLYTVTIDSSAHERRNAEIIAKLRETEENLLNNATVNDENTVFVRNVPYDATDKDVSNFFASCGTIVKCSVPRDKNTGAGKGIAFVTFTVFAGVLQALARDNDELLGKNVRIKKSDVKNIDRGAATTGGAGGSGAGVKREDRVNGGFDKYKPQSTGGPSQQPTRADKVPAWYNDKYTEQHGNNYPLNSTSTATATIANTVKAEDGVRRDSTNNTNSRDIRERGRERQHSDRGGRDSGRRDIREDRDSRDRADRRENRGRSGGRNRSDSRDRRTTAATSINRKRDRSESASPPRRRQQREPSLSPPRRQQREPSLSPPRRQQRETSLSPPRRQQREPSLSPPRRQQRETSLSPPRRQQREPSLSPPRRQQREPSLSPPRRQQREPSLSPPRRQQREPSLSPPRRQQRD